MLAWGSKGCIVFVRGSIYGFLRALEKLEIRKTDPKRHTTKPYL